jgi:quinoprotein glucose dehydrogenase
MLRRFGNRHTVWLAALLTIVVAGVALSRGPASASAQAPKLVRGNAPGEWRYWGADAWSTRYSPLDQINASNFGSLQIAWRFDVGDMFGEDEYFRSTPLYANGKLYSVAGGKRGAISLDPATGKLLWKWGLEEGIRYTKSPRPYSGRGLAYWTDGTSERILLVTPGYHLAAIDAKTGNPDPKFGKNGVVDLMDGLGYPLVPWAVDDPGELVYSDANPPRKAKPGETWDAEKKIGADGSIGIDPALGQVGASSPPIVVGDTLIVGNSAIHGYYPIRVRNLTGTIRGFDIKTGKQLWKFNLVPQPGEYGADTWKNGSKNGDEGVGKVDAWAPYSADPELGLVYIPVGMPIQDEYGGHRPGNNLFATSLVALDVKTGKRKWHYQMVHHDIWDYDTPMAPNLLDIRINGRVRKIVAQTTKQGFVYTFDRETGEPIWPINEMPVEQTDVPGEQTSATQPIPSRPAPYAQQGLVESDLIDYTPAIKQAALTLAQKCRMGKYYIPGSATDGTSKYPCSWYAPGASGGVNIDGGTAADPETGMMYVGSISPLSTIRLTKDPCSEFRYSSPRNNCGYFGALPPPPGYTGPMNVFNPQTGRWALSGGAGGAGGGGGRGGGRTAGSVPCAEVANASPGTASCGGVSIAKPKEFGGITGYDMNSGDKKWWIPNAGFTEVTSTDPMFAGIKLPPVGGGGQPQVINTKTLVIYGQGRNGGPRGSAPQIFAVDKATGKQLASVQIPSKTTAVPMTYMHQGKQYIVFATGSGGTVNPPTTTSLIALALPNPGSRAGGPGPRR